MFIVVDVRNVLFVWGQSLKIFVIVVVVIGFLEGLQPRGRGDVKIEEVKLFSLKASPAIGAAFLAGKAAGITLPIDFNTHAEVYFQSTL